MNLVPQTGCMLNSIERFFFKIVVSLPLIVASSAVASQDLGWYEAIRTGNISTVRQFLDEGADPKSRVDTPLGLLKPLTIAIVDREEDIAILLFRRGARIEGTEEIDLLTEAASKGLTRVLEFVLTENPEYFSDPTIGAKRHGLRQSAFYGYFQNVELLLRLSLELGDPFAIEKLGEAANVALAQGYGDIGRRLIEFTAVPYFGALSVASYASSPGIVHDLSGLGADPEERYHREGVTYFSPLDLAVRRYDEGRSSSDVEIAGSVIWELLEAGADESDSAMLLADSRRLELEPMIAADPQRALIEAAQLGYYHIVYSLVGSEDPLDDVRASLLAATRSALQSNHDDIAHLLLQVSGTPGEGLLHAAARHSSPGMVRYLISLGADPMAVFEGKVPLEFWLERVEVNGGFSSGSLLHELIVGGAEPCWLTDYEDVIGVAAFVLRNSATQCWPD